MHKNKGQPALKESHYQQLAYAFALRGRDYEYAWCVEHDVALTGGNWLKFSRITPRIEGTCRVARRLGAQRCEAAQGRRLERGHDEGPALRLFP